MTAGPPSDDEPGALLSAEGLEVRYHGGPDPAVRDVALRLRPGQGLLVCGPSGAGKTSLLRGLLGLVPHGGRVRLAGAAPGTPAARRRVGYGPQGAAFATGLRVEEAVRAVAAARGASGPGVVREALERAGLGYVTRWRTARLDAEGARRLSLAVAIAGDPDVVLLDDAWAMRDTLREIARARERGAVVLATATRAAGLGPALGGRADMADGVLR